jgi:hypothetical protein
MGTCKTVNYMYRVHTRYLSGNPFFFSFFASENFDFLIYINILLSVYFSFFVVTIYIVFLLFKLLM